MTCHFFLTHVVHVQNQLFWEKLNNTRKWWVLSSFFFNLYPKWTYMCSNKNACSNMFHPETLIILESSCSIVVNGEEPLTSDFQPPGRVPSPGLGDLFAGTWNNLILLIHISPWISLHLFILVFKQYFEMKFKQNLHLFGFFSIETNIGRWQIFWPGQ